MITSWSMAQALVKEQNCIGLTLAHVKFTETDNLLHFEGSAELSARTLLVNGHLLPREKSGFFNSLDALITADRACAGWSRQT